MKTVQWQMQENFNFPTSTGMPTGAETVKVTPRFTIDRTKASVRLTGIYHLAVNVKLDGEVGTRSADESTIFIDDVDLEGDTAYFEYAVPFNIDLPPEADDPLNIVTTNAMCEPDGQGTIGVIWDVECSYREVVIVQEESPEQKAAHAEAKLAAKVDLESEPILEVKSEPVLESKPKPESKPKLEKKSEIKPEPKLELKTELEPEPVVELEPELEQVVELEPEEDESVSATAEIKLENVSFSEEDEVLGFIMGLDDGYSATSFRSNDVSVQSES